MLPEIILGSSPPQESGIVQVWEGGLLFLSGNRFYHTEGVIEVKDCLFISKINENKNIYKIDYNFVKYPQYPGGPDDRMILTSMFRFIAVRVT